MRTRGIAFVAVLGMLAMGSLAWGEYITNGSFETGNYTGWSTAGPVNPGVWSNWSGPNGQVDAYDGTYYYVHQMSSGYGALYQTVAVDAGQEVTVDFAWCNLWSGPGYVTINNTSSAPSIGGDFFKGLQASCEYTANYTGTMADWAVVSQTFDSDGYITVSVFSEYDGGSAVTCYDAVSVYDTPEPATLALLCVGGSLALRRRRK